MRSQTVWPTAAAQALIPATVSRPSASTSSAKKSIANGSNAKTRTAPPIASSATSSSIAPRRIINQVAKTSDVPFDWTLNPYRGCEHGCIYCFARPYHEYLGFSCGLDFETKLMAKPDAAKLLRQELAAPSWKPEPIVMSAITDIYQPIEHKLQIARQCLEVLAECGQPVTTMTKSALVLRDIDLWSRLASMNAGRVTITIVTLDSDLAQKLEPRASSPAGRLRAIRELTAAGIPVTVNVAPIIPGLTDVELPRFSKQSPKPAPAAPPGSCSACLIRSKICSSTG